MAVAEAGSKQCRGVGERELSGARQWQREHRQRSAGAGGQFGLGERFTLARGGSGAKKARGLKPAGFQNGAESRT